MLVQGTCEYHHSLGRERSFVVDQATPMEPLDGSWSRKLPQPKSPISRCCSGLATFRRKIEALGCCRRMAQGMENCKVGQI
jgi:hypothetical protein